MTPEPFTLHVPDEVADAGVELVAEQRVRLIDPPPGGPS
jgi:hypothetical protein